MFSVTVIYATPEKQVEIKVVLPENATVELAIRRSNILSLFPEIQLGQTPVGLNSRQVKLDAPLQDDDRVEIYRPLLIDPKEARRLKIKSEAHTGV